MKLPICKRLLCCAALVPEGARVADIGCDHGYLGIHLLQSGQASFVHACDLREGPIHRAMENALKFGTAEKMRFSRADGLSAVSPQEIDTIVCAGMGGDLIVQILKNAPWVRNEKYTLILQPQSSGQEVRRVLSGEGFGIVSESLAQDGGFLYNIIMMRYGNAQQLTPGQQFCPAQLLQSGDKLLPAYLSRIEGSLRSTVAGIAKGNNAEDREKLAYYRAALEEISALL